MKGNMSIEISSTSTSKIAKLPHVHATMGTRETGRIAP
jgi:hypothetical protein